MAGESLIIKNKAINGSLSMISIEGDTLSTEQAVKYDHISSSPSDHHTLILASDIEQTCCSSWWSVFTKYTDRFVRQSNYSMEGRIWDVALDQRSQVVIGIQKVHVYTCTM